MNPHIVLPLVACVAELLSTVTAASTPRLHSLVSVDNPATPTSLEQQRVPRQAVSGRKELKARIKFIKQIRQLHRLECKPKAVKVSVKDYIGPDNDLWDKDPHPEAVVVKRCLSNCSYCGDNGGFEKKVCVSERTRNKTVILLYTASKNRLKPYKIRIPEDKKCRCK